MFLLTVALLNVLIRMVKIGSRNQGVRYRLNHDRKSESISSVYHATETRRLWYAIPYDGKRNTSSFIREDKCWNITYRYGWEGKALSYCWRTELTLDIWCPGTRIMVVGKRKRYFSCVYRLISDRFNCFCYYFFIKF